MEGTDYILDRVREALDEFEMFSLASSARRALRVAQLKGDAVDRWWFEAELKPMGGSRALRRMEVLEIWPNADPRIASGVDRQLVDEWMAERTPAVFPDILKQVLGGERMVLAGSIEELVADAEEFRTVLSTALSGPDAAVLRARLQVQREIIERIRYRVHRYLCRCEAQLAYAALSGQIFEQHRARVDRVLTDMAPEALEAVTAAYRRAREGDPEGRRHALDSCRMVIKTIADVVYPPEPEPFVDGQGQRREVGEEQYKNRLIAFFQQRWEHGAAGRVAIASIEDFARRVDRLNDLASKGVHGPVTQQEVDLCVIHTYLFAGEVPRLAQTDESAN